jgi:HEAT repeat protein
MNCTTTRSQFLLLSILAVCGCSPRDSQESRRHQPTATANTAVSAGSALREQLIVALSGYEHMVDKSELEQLASPADLVETLTAIYGDKTVRLNVRIQALASLRFFPTPEAKQALESALAAPGTSDVVRRSALKAYGFGFRDESISKISLFLDHRDLHTRNAAARALTDLHTERALAVLRLRFPVEQDAMVKSTIQAGLDRAK